LDFQGQYDSNGATAGVVAATRLWHVFNDMGGTGASPTSSLIVDSDDDAADELSLDTAGTLTVGGQTIASNLGLELTESDTNPTCAAGNFTIYADLSENKLKKCQNGTAADLDTTGGAPSFDQISGGTNANALVIGTNGSLGVSGTGTISATSMSGTGQIDDNDLAAGAVDLDTTEVAGTLGVANGGTGQATALAAFNGLDPLTTLGDVLYHNGTDSVRLAGNTTTTKKFMTQTGDGAISAAPGWGTLAAGDLPSHAHAAGDLTSGTLGVARGGTGAATLTGLLLGNGTNAVTTITDSSANWDTAYTDRLKWDGGATGLTAATGRTSLGLGTLATQAATSVAISGGAIDGTTVGLTTASSGKFTSLTATGNTLLGDNAADTVILDSQAATDDSFADAPTLTFRGSYDATAGAGVAATDYDLVLLHDVTGTGPASQLAW